MTLHIPLTAETEAELVKRAAAEGKGVSEYVLEAVQEKLHAPASLAEILAPVHAATRRAGMTEDEVDALIEESRDELRAGKRS